MKDDLPLLNHIRDAIERIESYVQNGEEAFLADSMIQDAVIRNFEIIGEATKGLSASFRDENSEIPWKQIAGMRDFLIHVYFGVNLETVWQTVQTDLPPLKKIIEAKLAGA